MKTTSHSKTAGCILGTLLVCGGAGGTWACSIPVFRYALEKGPASAYSVSVIQSGPLSPNDQALVARLNQPGVRAVEVTDVASRPPAPEGAGVPPPALPPALPWLILRHQVTNSPPMMNTYPPRRPIVRRDGPETSGKPDVETQVTWEAPLNPATVDLLLNAPERTEIARRLLAGDSAVWLVFQGANADENAAVTGLLNQVLRKAEQELVLPQATVQSSSSIPLKLSFSVLTIAPGTPGGDLLKKMLRPLAPEFESTGRPAIVPVYGRGRALTVITGKDLTEPSLRQTCEFLVGTCSCMIKAQKPGVELFIAVDWESKVVDRPGADRLPAYK